MIIDSDAGLRLWSLSFEFKLKEIMLIDQRLEEQTRLTGLILGNIAKRKSFKFIKYGYKTKLG